MRREFFKICTLALLLTTLLALPASGDDDEERQRIVVRSSQSPSIFCVGDDEDCTSFSFGGGGYLGVQMSNLTPELRSHFGLSDAEVGILVSKVMEDSPAARAGVQVGDIITGVDGSPVRRSGDLSSKVRGKEEGETLSIDLWRDGRFEQLSAQVEKRSGRAIVDLGGLFSGFGDMAFGEVEWDEDARKAFAEAMESARESWQEIDFGSVLDGVDWGEVSDSLRSIDFGEIERSLEDLDIDGIEERMDALRQRMEELEQRLDEELNEPYRE